MKYQEIAALKRPVSRIVLGTSSPLFTGGGNADGLLQEAQALGINCLDTAREYRESERVIGRYLAGSGRREDWVILSKCCHPVMAYIPRVSERCAREDLARSLEYLGTEHIDLYLLHRDDPLVEVGRVVDFMNRLMDEGHIRAYGGSNWSAARVKAANEYAQNHGLRGFEAVSPHYSLGRQRHDPWGNGCRTLTGAKHREEREYFEQTQLPVFCWSSLCAGVFSGKLKSTENGQIFKKFGLNPWWGYDCRDNYARLARCEELAAEKNVSVAQLTLAWILDDPLRTFPVAAPTSVQRLRDVAAAADLELSPAERSYLNLETEARA